MRTIYLFVNTNNEVEGWSSSPGMEGSIEVSVAEDHPFLTNSFAYRYVDGVLYFDQAWADELNNPVQPVDPMIQLQDEVADLKAAIWALLGPDPERHIEVATQFGQVIAAAVVGKTETEALKTPDLYPGWELGVSYKVADVISYGKSADDKPLLYSVIQAHTSQKGWEPPKVPALFKTIGFTAGGTAVWVQPLGGHDAYAKNVMVSHKNQIWKSDVDGNVWEPGVYGWTLQTTSGNK